MSSIPSPPVVLSIAGSDSGGGAGIQADLKAFAAAGVHGTTALTAITAQNTVGVTAIHQIPAKLITDQIDAVASDFGLDAIKVGMLGDATTIEAVAGALRGLAGTPIVVDPVMVSESGAALLEPDASSALTELVLPLATVLTPNLPEARALVDEVDAGEEIAALASLVQRLGPEAVVVTGGHTDEGEDVLVEADGTVTRIGGERHPDGASHGSGCTHSSTLAAHLAHGVSVPEAARHARAAASRAVGQGLTRLGAGPGPVDVLGISRRR